MASSRKSPRAEADAARAARADPVEAAVATALLATSPELRGAPGASAPEYVVALSGGRDSMVLLHALAAVRAALPFTLRAAHVHHGLSPQAEAWATFCAAACARLAVPLAVERVRVARPPGASLEAQAREARYRALLRMAGHARGVVLAHHADDQAETVLLQWLRGAGPHGLAGMAARSRPWGDSGPVVLRPFLALPGASLAAYAAQHELPWVEDESNADTRWRRNALRHDVLPAVRKHFPGYPGTIVRAAGWQAEAAGLLDELAAMDARTACSVDGKTGLALDRASIAQLAAERTGRARNLLRWFLRQHGLRPPSAARLDAMLEQCLHARDDARVELRHAGATIGVHGGRVLVHGSVRDSYAIAWHGERVLHLPGGILEFADTPGDGLAASRVDSAIEIRPRRAGEHIRLRADGPIQSVAGLFQSRKLPLWERRAWPLLWCDDRLVAVPGFGVDAAFRARPGEGGITAIWTPGTAAHGDRRTAYATQAEPEECPAARGSCTRRFANGDPRI